MHNARRLGLKIAHYSSFALKSKQLLEGLVLDKEVRTEIDPVNAITNHHDKYKRFLAYIYVGDLMVNEALINEGHCWAYTRFEFRHKELFVEYEENARDNEKGIWG